MNRPFVARKLLVFTLGFAFADILTVYGLLTGPWWIAGFVALFASLFFAAREKTALARLILAGAVVGLTWSMLFSQLFLRPVERMTGTTGPFTATVTALPSPTRYGVKIPVRMSDPCAGMNAVVYSEEAPEGLLPGDEIRGEGKFTGRVDDREMDDDSYYRSNGVYLTVSARGELSAKSVETPPIRDLPARFSVSLRENLKRVIPEDVRGLFLALVIGDRSALPERLRFDLSIDGIYHAVCLSGMHVSLLAAAVFLLFRRKRFLTALIGIPILWCFVLLTGAASATVRAAVMQSFLLLAPAMNREYDAPTSLAAALLLLLIANPWSVAAWGLQLSFISTAGILLLAPRLYRAVLPATGKRRPAPIRYLVGGLTVTLAATVTSQPLVAIYFGLSSVVAPLANLLILWSVTVCFAGGFLVAILAFFSLPAAAFLGSILAWAARYCSFTAGVLARIPHAAVYDYTPLMVLASQSVYLGTVVAILQKTRRMVTLCALASIVAVCVSLTVAETSPGGLTALDVGQGQCLICRKDGETVVTDCGGSVSDVGEQAARFLVSQGDREVKALILTHFDSDHTDGLEQLLRRVSVRELLIPAVEEPSPQKERVTSLAERCGVPVTEIRRETRFPLGSGTVTVYPPVDGGSDNAGCVCALFSVEDTDFLVTGDLPRRGEEELLARYELPDLEVLMAGHHGGKDATGSEILSALAPETVLISVGKNTYGHPARETLRRIAAVGATAYRTDENGTITLRW